jgi:hypothetical protein
MRRHLAKLADLAKRYTAFCAVFFLGALLGNGDIAIALLRLLWAFATNPTPERAAFVAFDAALVAIWLIRKHTLRARAA